MTERDLAAEIVAVLSTGEHTMLAIARQVRARNQDVIDHVRVLEAAGRVYHAEGPDGRLVYGLASTPRGTRGNRLTDTDRLLAVLADGRPHNHLELYGLNMIVHSRVADLRKRGHDVRSWRESHPNGPRYWYELVGAPLTDGESSREGRGSSSVSGSVLDEQGPIPGGSPACHAGAHDDGSTGEGQAASIEPLQLTFGEAA